MMKKLVIFDLDGTLLDTSDGIMYSYKAAGEKLGLVPNEVSNRKIVIGGPLRDGFNTLYKITSEKQIDEAITAYRSFYMQEGIKRFKVYNGIETMLISLRENGFKTAVATLKLEEYAVKMLSDAGLSRYFGVIRGWDGTDKSDKSTIIAQGLSDLQIAPINAVLVGDSVYDEKGASIAGVDFLGVSYGFGIKKEKSANSDFPIVNSPKEVAEFFM